jgi:hypothetical protein
LGVGGGGDERKAGPQRGLALVATLGLELSDSAQPSSFTRREPDAAGDVEAYYEHLHGCSLLKLY